MKLETWAGLIWAEPQDQRLGHRIPQSHRHADTVGIDQTVSLPLSRHSSPHKPLTNTQLSVHS